MGGDAISDLLTRIRNANMVYLEVVEIPSSKITWAIAKLLKQEGFLKDCILVVDKKGLTHIKMTLKYSGKRKRVISGIQRISKPGRRVYSSIDELKQYRKTFGVTLLSTPKGILTDKLARQQKVGGEVLCVVW